MLPIVTVSLLSGLGYGVFLLRALVDDRCCTEPARPADRDRVAGSYEHREQDSRTRSSTGHAAFCEIAAVNAYAAELRTLQPVQGRTVRFASSVQVRQLEEPEE